MKPHICSHTTCSFHRTGDSMIVICETCGERATYPLEQGGPFPPERQRIPAWALWLVACILFCAFLVFVAILSVFTPR